MSLESPEWWVALKAAIPGFAGGLVGALRADGSWKYRMTLWVCGGVTAYFISGYASERLHVPEGVVGFVIGVFGLPIVDKALETIKSIPLAQTVSEWIRKRLGLPEKPQ